MKNSLFVTVPHSGERIPEEAHWLHGLPEPVQMCDVDRYVNELYQPAIDKLGLPHIIADTHRYVVDLNRIPSDIDQASVIGAELAPGSHPTGFHWSVTTQGDSLITSPISMQLHDELTRKYWAPFHQKVRDKYAEFSVSSENRVFQIDAHSMPSLGTEKHRDPGETRAEVVISDQEGVSCDSDFRDLVIEAYKQAGFEVKINWPYLGGRVTQTYGKPDIGQNCIQVELNRALYMNERTKAKDEAKAGEVAVKLVNALSQILEGLKRL
ncbi:MAG: N-formylglutamate amidohydrolase [Bdellovibrionales bacterium]|nr:N-formylglutamate amidohydrolase [Bdellovibrionales bacterium]